MSSTFDMFVIDLTNTKYSQKPSYSSNSNLIGFDIPALWSNSGAVLVFLNHRRHVDIGLVGLEPGRRYLGHSNSVTAAG